MAQDFIRPLPGPLTTGMVITIDGFIPGHSQGFSVNLSTTPNYLGGDLLLHANVRFNEGNQVVRNSYQNGGWQAEERGGSPVNLPKNQNFQCTITSYQDKIAIAFNGQPYCDFRHRFSQERVNHVIMHGDVQVFNVTFGGGQYGGYGQPQQPSGYGQPQQPGGYGGFTGQPGGYGQPTVGFSQTPPQPGQPGFGQQPGGPYGQPPAGAQPQKKNIPGGLYPGRMIYINGSINPGARNFRVNLKSQEFGGDIFFHLDVRFQEQVVVRNSLLRGAWGNEERQQPEFPFQPGQPFSLIILTEQGCFKVAVNNKHFIEFNHRDPNFQAIQWVECEGETSGIAINTS